MTQVTFWEPSGEVTIPGKGTARDHYASGAFDGVTGQRVPFRSRPGGDQIGWATVISVVVDDDGLGATWTVDLETGPEAVPSLQGRSFAFRSDTVQVRDPLASKPPVIRRQGEQ